MDRDIAILIMVTLVFGAATLLAYVASAGLVRRGHVRQRFQDLAADVGSLSSSSVPKHRSWIRLTPAQLRIDPPTQRELRRKLIRAGFFDPNGLIFYTIGRWLLLVILPVGGTLAIVALDRSKFDALTILTAAAALLAIGYYLPRAFLNRRERWLQDKYRVTFPEVLDMLVVCVNAGLSLDAALNRVTQELGPEDAELQANLNLMAGEMRAGRSSVDALKDCAERLGLPEAISLASLLQQSIELGTDVSLSLTTFADEMRDKRMSNAEEKASSLPPKLTLPLGLFIFPVVLIVVLAPVVLRLMRAGA